MVCRYGDRIADRINDLVADDQEETVQRSRGNPWNWKFKLIPHALSIQCPLGATENPMKNSY
jgi:hypothetical protein